MTIYFHMISTGENPHHDHCDIDWCYSQQARLGVWIQSRGGRKGKHDPPIPREASEQLLPLFQCLSGHELLGWCMSLGTSNANESLHAVTWIRAPKAVFSSRKTGNSSGYGRCPVQQGIRHAAQSDRGCHSTDRAEFTAVCASRDRAEVAAKQETRSSRTRKSLQRIQGDKKLLEEESHLYDPGAHLDTM